MQRQLLKNESTLISFIQSKLYRKYRQVSFKFNDIKNEAVSSAVLVPIGTYGRYNDPCLIFNKRSQKVMQPGDLCFPGGRVAPKLDSFFSKWLMLPMSPLTGWKYWPSMKSQYPNRSKNLSLTLTTAIRESLEEMRLNPFGVKFIGPLPEQHLVLFKRRIFPMVGWINQDTFFPNWEVESVIKIPLYSLLNPENYAAYHLYVKADPKGHNLNHVNTLACFRHKDTMGEELLWGVTYRIAADFLKIVFGFSPPDLKLLPSLRGILTETYLSSDSKPHSK